MALTSGLWAGRRTSVAPFSGQRVSRSVLDVGVSPTLGVLPRCFVIRPSTQIIAAAGVSEGTVLYCNLYYTVL